MKISKKVKIINPIENGSAITRAVQFVQAGRIVFLRHLTAVLAEKVMGWSIGPDRFMMGDRRWMPRWRFQPAENLTDAFELLDGAAPDEYSMSGGNGVGFQVRVRIGNVIGEARETSKPLAITYAIARAAGIEVQP